MSIRASIENLQQDLRNVQKDLGILTSELASMAKMEAEESKERLLAQMSILCNRSAHLKSSIRRATEDGRHCFEQYVREQPYKTSVVAGALGGMLAWLVLRKGK